MEKFKVTHNIEKCIGCGACAAACPGFWKMESNGKAFLKGGKGVLKIGEKDLECNKNAAESCPVNAIQITDSKGKKTV